MKNKQLLATPFILTGMVFILIFGALKPDWLLQLLPAPWINNAFVDAKLKYQLVSLVVAILVLAITRLFSPKNAGTFYSLGELSAPAKPIKWLGIKPGETWRSVGLSFSVIMTLVTAIFIYLNVAKGQSFQKENLAYIPFILLFSMTNAFIEEAIWRTALVTSFFGVVKTPIIYLLSGVLFGIPHFFGTPGGIIGVLMAGFLGWLLSKSVVETQGSFWAWFIHFLQDVIIFTGLFMVAL